MATRCLIIVNVRARLLVSLVAAVSLPSGCGGTVSRPVFASVPTAGPSSVKTTPCVVSEDAHRELSGTALVFVDRHPVAVEAVWIPGLNQRPCRSEVTRGTAVEAAKIAAAIDAAPRFPSGDFSCPNDDRSATQLYFSYPSHRSQMAEVALSGCTSVHAPGRRARQLTVAVREALGPLEPPAWRLPGAG